MTCPICQSSKVFALYSVDSLESAAHFAITGWDKITKVRFSRLENEIKQIWNSDSCRVMECKNCGCSYSSPYIAGTSTFYNLAFDPGYPKDRWEYSLALESIKKIPGFKTKKYLEMGAGKGIFLKKLLDLGINFSRIKAEEYSEKGMREIEKLNIHRESNPKSKFDTIILFQVFEHLDNQKVFLKNTYERLNSGGKLIISIPNPALIRFTEKLGGLKDMPPNHVLENTHKSLSIQVKNLFEITDFKISKETSREILDQVRHYKELEKRILDYADISRKSKENIIAEIILKTKLFLGVRLGSAQYFELTKI